MVCTFCEQEGGRVLWRDAQMRIVHAEVEGYTGFLRVILNRHVREMTDLTQPERDRLMRGVYAAEGALRALARPEKVNLASLGNQVPHLHWHVIARHADDPHYPDPVWGVPKRAAAKRPGLDQSALAARLETLLQ